MVTLGALEGLEDVIARGHKEECGKDEDKDGKGC